MPWNEAEALTPQRGSPHANCITASDFGMLSTVQICTVDVHLDAGPTAEDTGS